MPELFPAPDDDHEERFVLCMDCDQQFGENEEGFDSEECPECGGDLMELGD